MDDLNYTHLMTFLKWHNDSNNMDVYLDIILKKHNVLSFQLDDGLEVSFTDKRRLARVRLLEDVSDPFLLIVTIYSCLESLLSCRGFLWPLCL